MTSSTARVRAQAPDHAPTTGPAEYMLAEFHSPDALVQAAEKVRSAGYTRFDAHSPFPVHGIDRAMGTRRTILPVLIFIGGAVGASVAVGIQWWMNASNPLDFKWLPTFLQGYQFLISGKPWFSFPANIPIMFELTVLFASLTAVFGMLILNGLPQLYNVLFMSDRFLRVTDDRFFISIQAADPKFSEASTRNFLTGLGAAAVETIRRPPNAAAPRWILHAGLILACLALLPPVLAARARSAKSGAPRVHVVYDMDNQEKYKAQHPNYAFADGRAMRPPVAGTVARGELYSEDHLNQGYRQEQTAADNAVTWFDGLPPEISLTRELLERGRDRFMIFCAPCHGYDGSGNGPVARRAEELAEGSWVAPLSMNDPLVRSRPDGHIFNTITNGIRTMPAYDRIPPADRWAIVAYVRALQRAADASIDDVPAEMRSELLGNRK